MIEHIPEPIEGMVHVPGHGYIAMPQAWPPRMWCGADMAREELEIMPGEIHYVPAA